MKKFDPTGAEPGRRGRRGERGAAGPLGLVAVFLATAIVLTVAMLFVTGVAQRGILPRVRAKAFRAVPETPEATAPALAAGDRSAPGGESDRDAHASGQPQPDLTPAQLDSLKALKAQIQTSRVSLDDRIAEAQQEARRLVEERSQADEEAEQRIKALAKVYSSMKPEAAARVMAHLDDDTFARVLDKVDRRQAAKILTYIDPARVARLTQEAATSLAERDHR